MKTRIIWAVILILLSYLLVTLANDIIFTIIVGLVSIIACRELLNTQKDVPLAIRFEMYMILVGTCAYTYFYGMLDIQFIILIFLLYTVSLVLYQQIETYNFTNIGIIFIMTLYLVFGFNALVNVKINFSLLVFLYPIVIAVLADTFGYFGGMLFGKHKLIKNISPKKTWEGAIAATIFPSLISFFYLKNFDFSNTKILTITIIVVILSQLGDLVASSIKRTYNIKDYSNLIPGHGGILDRFDSIIFNFIVLSVILLYV